MWARARYDLGLSSAEFWRMTPRQFAWLDDRHRERLAHEELVGAWITAAVKNHSMCQPEEPAKVTDYMPSHRESRLRVREHELTDDELERQSDYNIRVAELAAQLREQAGGR